jgi:nucleoside-diphosphate-sugar epimerase
MRVLVTGLSHPIGNYICELGALQGVRVRAVASAASGMEQGRGGDFELISGTLEDDAVLAAAVRDVDVVYHTALIAQRPAEEMHRVNAEGTRRLLEACAGDVRRFVFLSTPAVYASHPTPDTWPVRADARREAHGTAQLTAYAQSIIDAEDYILEASRLYGMDYVLLRTATLWGRNPYAGAIVAALMRNPDRAEQMNEIFGPMQWLHGADAARAALLAGEHAAARHEAFIVAGTEPATCFDFLAILWDITRPEEANPFAATADARRPPHGKLDIGKIEQALGFRPAISLRESLEEALGRIEIGADALVRTAVPTAAVRPDAAEPVMAGKTCVITGATSGIGLAAAERLAAMGARLVLVGRDRRKGEAVLSRLRGLAPSVETSMHYADLSLLDEVRRVAAEILAAAPRIDVLINNVGAIFDRREVTADGLERTFAINHMAHFLLTALLRDRLVASAPARIVTVASSGHQGVTLDFDDLQGERAFNPGIAYQRSKLCNILFTRELALRLADTGVTANCLEPGLVATNLGSNTDGPIGVWLARAKQTRGVSPEVGAQTAIYLATSSEVAAASGRYFSDGRAVAPSPAALDEAVARRLWEISSKLAAGPG